MGRRGKDVGALSLGHSAGIAMGAVFGMFWMRVVLAFTYVETIFFMILPVSVSILVVAEQRSLGPIFDKLLFKIQSIVYVAIESSSLPRKARATSTATTLTEGALAQHEASPDSSPAASPVHKAVMYRKSSAASNSSELISTAQSSLFAGVGIGLRDHTMGFNAVSGQSKPIYLQEVNSGYFVKSVDGRLKLTARPDDSCLFIWVRGKTHHWGLLSLSTQRFLGQNVVSMVVVSAKKLQNWEAFRVLQNADVPSMAPDDAISCPIHLILCSARFGKGMWLSTRLKEGDRVLSLSKNYASALCVRYASDLVAFKKDADANEPRPSRSSSSSSSPARDSFVGDAPTLPWLSATASFFQSTSFATILTQTLENVTMSSLTNLFVDAYDVMLPDACGSWSGHPTLGNVRLVSYPISPGSVDEYHACKFENDELSFKIKVQFHGLALGDTFSLEVEYLLKSLSDKRVSLTCLKAVHWRKPTLFQRHIDTASRAAVLGAAQQLAALLVARNHSSKVLWNLPTLLYSHVQQQFERNQVEHLNVLEPLSLPWKSALFFESESTKTVYATMWPITPSTYFEWFVSDASAFFRKTHDESKHVNVDMSPWTYHNTLGHVRKQTFTMPVEGLAGHATTTVREYQWYEMNDAQLLRYGSKIYVGDLPDGHAFSVEVRYDVQLDVPTQTQSRVTSSIGVVWTHSSKFQAGVDAAVAAAVPAAMTKLLGRIKANQHEVDDVREIQWLPSQDDLTAALVEAIVAALATE
ncbi:hypothetical protein SDRG_07079 [Saprolegnia diclina VS20]|uniref:VASt domain-containing protein n=1 Tax=Saprolegnia diclina (strain VS20) TaxID=1156394 RepID=T0RYA9_SAPDV|nr:hypothetical protein SDRG_07079 [Saprolegnia diclina VS20]EQC35367.1 hypothetical protein SDRG_07079 [Saprolegnia diclina VS20]|eukprot:XP_008611117.1 hypothetical protein SDRG_07079 [Saprolegnia diclina VS20]